MSDDRYLREARRIEAMLPPGPRVAVIGSTSLWQADSEATCVCIGQRLASIDIVLLTGGVEGVGEATGRAFFAARGDGSHLFHILPHGEPEWDYGTTLYAGDDMTQRREVLGRLARLYVAIEGGPGTLHEAELAHLQGAVVIPVGRSGGHARELYSWLVRPAFADVLAWRTIGDSAATPEQTADAVLALIRAGLAAT